MRLLRWPAVVQVKLHCPQPDGSSPEWVCTWIFKVWIFLMRQPHNRKGGGWNFTHLALPSVKWLDYQPYGWNSNQADWGSNFDDGRIIQFYRKVLFFEPQWFKTPRWKNLTRFKRAMSTTRYLKMSFPDVMVGFPTTRLCKKMQILQKSPEDVKLFHLNSPKL